jgi:hypothetical protein
VVAKIGVIVRCVIKGHFTGGELFESQRSFLSVNGGVSQSVEYVKYEKENSIWSQQVIELEGHSPKSCSRAESKVQVHTLHVIHG